MCKDIRPMTSDDRSMNDIEKYEFDRLGFLVIKDMIDPEEARSMLGAGQRIGDARAGEFIQPASQAFALGMGADVIIKTPKLGYHAAGEKATGKTLIVEDFWNASPGL